MRATKTLKFILSHPINRRRKIKALMDFARWQLGSRIVDGDIVYNWIEETKFLVEKGVNGLTGNIYAGLHEFEEMCFVIHYLRPGDLFVDVGANAGSYTILACAVAKSDGMAFEPVPVTFKRLKNNVYLNEIEFRVECIEKVVGGHDGVIRFTVEGDATNHVVIESDEKNKTDTFDMTTLDIELETRMPSVLKIDVEGYETEVILGARATLCKASLNAVILELNGSGNRYGYDETQIVETLLDCGFEVYSYDPHKRLIKENRGKTTLSGNMLFLKKESLNFIADRLITAKSVMIKDSIY